MKASGLEPNMQYMTTDGRIVTVLDNTPIPDGQTHQRKILVAENGVPCYVLPRIILRPMSTNTAATKRMKRRSTFRTALETDPETDSETEPTPAPMVTAYTPSDGMTPTPIIQSLTVTAEEARPLTIDDPRLDILRPDPALADQYISRIMPNGETDVEYLMSQWAVKKNIMLEGDTQGGKTMLVNVLAIKIGEAMGLGKPVPVFTLSASNGITDFDLFGQPTAWTDPATGIERLVWLPGTCDMAARVGGILYIDEANMMPERVTSSLHPMCDWRRAFVNRAKAVKIPGDGFMPETVKVSDDLWIVGTMNPNYRGAGALNEAFSQRFRHLDWSYNDGVEKRLIPMESVRTLGEALRTARATGHVRTPVGTSALMQVADDLLTVGVEMALFCLRSLFNAEERLVVDEIIETRSFKTLLANDAAGRHPLSGSGAGVMGEDTDSPF